jgi:hypothetical protein
VSHFPCVQYIILAPAFADRLGLHGCLLSLWFVLHVQSANWRPRMEMMLR